MTKTIKLSEEVYHLLREAQSGRETFCDTVARLLKIRLGVKELIRYMVDAQREGQP